MAPRFKTILAAALVAAASGVAAIAIMTPAQADTLICEKYGSTTIQGGRYIVQNNLWGADTPQCINVTSTGFQIQSANHNNSTSGAPASYPSVYAGCHYGNCSSGSGLPIQLTQLNNAQTSVSYSYTGGTYNASYDIWLDPTARTTGQNATEIMIWLNRQGNIQPIGSPVGTVTIEGRSWEVWYGNIGWNVISYVAPSAITSLSFNVLSFTNDVLARGYITRSWYLTSVQAGFEPWIGGTGLAVNSFSFAANGAVTGTTPPPAATTPPPAATTPPPAGTGACRVTYSIQSQWSGGFVANVTVTNTGSSALTGWTAGWSYASGQQVASGWNATVAQSGQTVTARSLNYNGALAPGASTTFGIQATGPTTPTPASFTCA